MRIVLMRIFSEPLSGIEPETSFFAYTPSLFIQEG